MKTYLPFTLIISIFTLCATPMFGQWATDLSINNPICTENYHQQEPEIAIDGQGGAIITWYDNRDLTHANDIYAQRISANGNVLWTTNGVAICDQINMQMFPVIVEDGQGGAIICWQDNRNLGNDDIYAQRIDKNGMVKWTQNGKAICSTANFQIMPKIVTDGNGGAIIIWRETQTGNQLNDLYAQRIDSNGNIQWNAAGVMICNAQDIQQNYDIIADGNGGAIFTWQDDRNGFGNSDVYAQRVNAAGITQWGNNGMVICNVTNDQQFPHLCTNGSGGAIITWQDHRNGWDIYAQMVSSAGVAQWTVNGDTICKAYQVQTYPNIVSDNNGGAIIAWTDFRSNTYYKVYAQRVNASGVVQWTHDGILISDTLSFQEYLEMIPDGAGGALISWDDFDNDIKIQRVSAAGTPLWTVDGTPVCTAFDDQFYPRMVSDNSGGAIVTWQDYRAVLHFDIYAQRMNLGGTGVENVSQEEDLIIYPNPATNSCSLYAKADFKFQITDFSGKNVYSGDGKKGGHQLDLSSFNTGIYLIKVQTADQSFLRKLVVGSE